MGAPVAPRSRKQGIKEALGFASLMVDVIVPPESSIQRKPKILGRVAVWDRMTCHGESSRGDGAGTGEEDNLGFGGIKGEAAGGPPLHQAIHSTLDPGNKKGWVIAIAEDGTVVCEGNPKGILVVDEADGFVEGQGPKASRADTAPGEAHAGGTLSGEVSVVVGHVCLLYTSPSPRDS